MMELAVLRSDIPFDDEAAQKEAARLGVTLYMDAAEPVIDPRPCMQIKDFLARRQALLDLANNANPFALICDADAAGHPMPLGQGISDLDSYIAALVQKGITRIVICNVRGTRELEDSIRFVKEKLKAYA